MSDIGINNISQPVSNNIGTVKPPVSSPTPSKAAEATASDSASKAEPQKDIVAEEYGDVVSVSEDGDTVRVKSEQNQEGIHDILQEELAELEDRADFEMPDFDVHRAKLPEKQPVATEDTSTEIQADITSYVGYSDSELKQLYLKGDISQIDYNQEMEAREARREAEASDSSQFNNSVANNISKLADVNRTSDTVRTIEKGDTSTTIPDELRLQALQNFDTI